jgi:uncharacterized membrane protein
MTSETSRVEAFSDGVFAIAITLLVLGIKVPGTATPLARGLSAQWSAYFAFVLSFAFIAVMWINHHRLFSMIRHPAAGRTLARQLLVHLQDGTTHRTVVQFR